MKSISRYAVRIGSALALLLSFSAISQALAAGTAVTFQGERIVFSRLVPQPGGRAVSIDDPGLRALFSLVGATVTWQTGQRYVLVTTAEPVVISFAIGDRRYDVGPVTQTAAFAPFQQDGHVYVPFEELVRALDLAIKPQGVLQPELTSIDLQNEDGAAKLIARGGMPLDARVVSDAGGKIVLAFEGVGSALPQSRVLGSGPVTRIDARTEGTSAHPRAIVTLYVAAGTTHTVGTDDERDFTIGFNGMPASQPIAAAEPTAEPEAIATPLASPSPIATGSSSSGPAQVMSVQAQPQNGGVLVRIAVDGNAEYEWHRLRPPDNRFWIDVHGAHLAGTSADLPGIDPVTGIRVRQQGTQTVRVALSLADFDVIQVTPDGTGVTIAVQNAVAQESAARAGSGTIGTTALTYVSGPPSENQWKFSPRPASAPNGPAYGAANPRLIVIDPGHGGSDWGSYRGDVIEKSLTLDMSRRLRDILVARGWQVVMTRESDRDVYQPNDSADDELQARDDIANGDGARLLVSVHVNAFINAGPHGATVYYYKSSDYALALAVDRRIAAEGDVKDDGVVKDKLYVIHHANMPATLIETAFLSNPDDRALLESAQWREKMAKAIADGIADYAGPPPRGANSTGQ